MVGDCRSIREGAAAAVAVATAAATFQTIAVKLAPSVLKIIQYGFCWVDGVDRGRLVYRIAQMH